MTPAAAIDVGSTGGLLPGQGLSHGKLPGTVLDSGRKGTAPQGFLPETAQVGIPRSVSGPESFRVGWQSMLASLVPGLDGLSGALTEAESVSKSAEASGGVTAGGSANAISNLIGVERLRAEKDAGEGNGEAGAATAPTLAKSGTRTLAVLLAVGTREPVLLKQQGKNELSSGKIETEGVPQHLSRFSKAAKSEILAVQAPSVVMQEALASVTQSVPTPVNADSAARSGEVKAQSEDADLPHADLSLARSSAFASRSFSPYPASPRGPGADAGNASTAARVVSAGDETSSRQGQLSLDSERGEKSGAIRVASEPTGVLEDVETPESTRKEGGNLSEKQVAAPSQTQMIAPTDDLPQAVPSSQEKMSAVAPGLSQIQTEMPVQSSTRKDDRRQRRAQESQQESMAIRAGSPSQNSRRDSTQNSGEGTFQRRVSVPPATPVLRPTQATAPTLNEASMRATDRNGIHQDAPDEELTNTVAAAQKTEDAAVAGLSSTQTFGYGQDSFQTIRSDLDQTQTVVPDLEVTQPTLPRQDAKQTVVPVRRETATLTAAPGLHHSGTSNLDSIASIDQRQSEAEVITPDLGPLQILASRQDSTERLVPGKVEGREVTPDLNPIPKTVTSQDQASTLEASKEESRTFVPASNPVQTAPLNQDVVPRLVSGRDIVQTHSPSLEQKLTVAALQDSSPSLVSSPKLVESPENKRFLSEPSSSRPNPHETVIAIQNSPGTAAPHESLLETAAVRENLSHPTAPGQDSPQPVMEEHVEPLVRLTKPGLDGTETSIAGPASDPPPVAVNAAPVASTPIFAPVAESVPVITSKSSLSGGERNSTPGTLRPVRGVERHSPTQSAPPAVEVQPSAPAVDASAISREVAADCGGVSTASGTIESATAAITDPNSRETFAALDAESASVKPAWIHAGVQRAEAGFEDPALGWVGVRAETGGGRVHAEVVPGSADAAQALSGHLAGLNAYLAEHHTQVETLTLTTPENGWAGQGSASSTGQSLQQGEGQQAGQQMAQSAESGSRFGSSQSAPALPVATSEIPTFQGGRDGSMGAERRQGVHISVMA